MKSLAKLFLAAFLVSATAFGAGSTTPGDLNVQGDLTVIAAPTVVAPTLAAVADDDGVLAGLLTRYYRVVGHTARDERIDSAGTTSITHTFGSGEEAVSISWDHRFGAEEYAVEYSEDGATWTNWFAVAVTEDSFVDTGAIVWTGTAYTNTYATAIGGGAVAAVSAAVSGATALTGALTMGGGGAGLINMGPNVTIADDGGTVLVIDTTELQLPSGGADIDGAVDIAGTLDTSGALTVAAGGADVTGDSDITGTLDVSGLTTLAGNLDVDQITSSSGLNLVGTGMMLTEDSNESYKLGFNDDQDTYYIYNVDRGTYSALIFTNASWSSASAYEFKGPIDTTHDLSVTGTVTVGGVASLTDLVMGSSSDISFIGAEDLGADQGIIVSGAATFADAANAGGIGVYHETDADFPGDLILIAADTAGSIGFYTGSSSAERYNISFAGVHNFMDLTLVNTESVESETFVVQELAAAPASSVGYGQVWVKDDTPNLLMFTDDAGTDFQVSGARVQSMGAVTNTTLYTPRWLGDELMDNNVSNTLWRAFGTTTNDWVEIFNAAP